ncbi:MAG: hypothetical protein EOO16_09760 [Chitinophagaceae bacterium]|nr:MAG: hypothetical protein EOO16_09760 [Chitinophagaceae bacterium]
MDQDHNKRIDSILGSLDGAARAEAGPYFYSRLRTRMEAGLLPKPLAWRLALALAIVAVLNVLTLRAVQHEPVADATAAGIASEYALTLPDSY